MDDVDFSMLRQSPRAGNYDMVINALDSFAKSRAAKKRQEEEMALKREQMAQRAASEGRYNAGLEERRRSAMAKEDLAEKRLAGEGVARNTRNEAALNEQVRGDIANSDFGRAQQRADAYSAQDPTTGEVRKGLPGFKIDRGTRPGMPASPVEYGPQSTPEISEEAAIIRAGQAAPVTDSPTDGPDGMAMGGGDVRGEFQRAEEERKRFAGQNSAPKDAAMALYQQQLAGYGRKQPDPQMDVGEIAPGSRERPDVTIAGVPTNPDDLRYSAGRAEAQDFQRLGAVLQTQFEQAVATKDPQSQAAAQRKMEIFAELAPQVETGRVPASKAMQALMGASTAENTREAALEQTALKGQQAQGRAETMATAQAQRGALTAGRAEATADRQEKRLGLDEQKLRTKNTKEDLNSFFQRWNAKTTQDAANTFPKIAEKLNSGNGKLQQDALIQMMRISQADNRFSDADAKMALTVGANWASQLESALSRGIEGDIGDDVLKIATKAANVLQGHYNEKTAAMNADADTFLDDDDLYDTKRAASVLGRELPTFRSRHPELFGKGPRASAGPRMDPNDPDNPNAPNADRPLDGDEAPVGGRLPMTPERARELLEERRRKRGGR